MSKTIKWSLQNQQKAAFANSYYSSPYACRHHLRCKISNCSGSVEVANDGDDRPLYTYHKHWVAATPPWVISPVPFDKFHFTHERALMPLHTKWSCWFLMHQKLHWPRAFYPAWSVFLEIAWEVTWGEIEWQEGGRRGLHMHGPLHCNFTFLLLKVFSRWLLPMSRCIMTWAF